MRSTRGMAQGESPQRPRFQRRTRYLKEPSKDGCKIVTLRSPQTTVRSLRLTLTWRGDQYEPFGTSFPYRPSKHLQRSGPMKFLVIRKPRTGTGMIPTAEMVRAHKEVLLSAVKRGEADCAYAFLGGGGFSIQNADSAEDLSQRMMGSPLGL